MAEVIVTIPGEAVAKGRARMTRAGHAFTPTKTRNAEAFVRHTIASQAGWPQLTGPLRLEIAVFLPIPQSWPKKRQAAAMAGTEWPTKRPDIDNYVKLVADAANGLLWTDDAQVVSVTASKVYGAEAKTVVRVAQINPHGLTMAVPVEPLAR